MCAVGVATHGILCGVILCSSKSAVQKDSYEVARRGEKIKLKNPKSSQSRHTIKKKRKQFSFQLSSDYCSNKTKRKTCREEREEETRRERKKFSFNSIFVFLFLYSFFFFFFLLHSNARQRTTRDTERAATRSYFLSSENLH